MQPQTNTSVSVKKLGVTYGTHKVLDALDLEVPRGEFLVLLGSSGCGKSTLLNAIAGLNDVSGGTIEISGRDVTDAEPKDRGIGMVFQSYALYPRMSVEGNMGFGLRIKGMKKAEVAERVQKTAALLQIDHLLKRKPADLSGGQRQRVAIGRALVRDVDVFLFDEPLSNLDAQLRAELRVELKRLHQEFGNTMIYVTHDQVEAMTLADRIAVMKGGQIQQLAPPEEVYERPANLFVAGFLGTPKMNFIEGEIRDGQNGRVFIAEGMELPVPEATGTGFAGPAVLGVRPEHLSLAEGPKGAGFEAPVSFVEPLGPETIVWVKVGGKLLSLRVSPELRLQPGAPIRLKIQIEKVSFFDRDTTARL